MIQDIVKYAPLNTVGVLTSNKTDYFIYIKEIIKLNRKSIVFIDIFNKKIKRNIGKDFYFLEFHHFENKKFEENELYKQATDGMNRIGVYNLANFMAHKYIIYKTGDIVILESNHKSQYIFIEKQTGVFWKGVLAFG